MKNEYLKNREGRILGRIHGDVSEAERKRVRKALELYCGQDTEGMVWILDALKFISLSFAVARVKRNDTIAI